jgi:hypothetical protein
MTTRARPAAVIFALAMAFAACNLPAASAAAPRSGGLSVSIILPVNGTTIKDDVAIFGNASGPDGVALSVQVSIDGGKWYFAEGNLSWSWLWSTFAFPDGPHTVTARVLGGGDESFASGAYLVRNKMPPFVLRDVFPPGDDIHLKAGDMAGFSVSLNTTYIGSLLYNWSLDGEPVESGGADWYNYTARAGELGNHSVRVEVIAEFAVQASHYWNLTVRALAHPPVVAGFGPADQNFTAYPGDTVRFNVTATDPQDKGLTYRWSFDLAPAPGNVTESTIDVLFNSIGTHAVEVLISNGETNRTVRWNVTVQEPPTLGLLDIMPCASYLIIGLFLGIWYGRRTREEERRRAQGAGRKA